MKSHPQQRSYIDSCWERENQFLLSVAPGKVTVLHWKATHLKIFRQHKLDLIDVKKKKKSQSCVKGIWEKFREKMK